MFLKRRLGCTAFGWWLAVFLYGWITFAAMYDDAPAHVNRCTVVLYLENAESKVSGASVVFLV